MPSVVKSFFKN